MVGPMRIVGGKHEFTHISHAALGPNGLLAVAQPSDGQVLLFALATPDSLIAIAGRHGEGPGEFSSVGSIGWIGNALWVTDGSRPRAEFFDMAGRVLISKGFDPPRAVDRRFRYFAPTAILRDTAVVYYPSVFGSPNSPTVATADPSVPILLMRYGAQHADTLAQVRPLKSMLVLHGDVSSAIAYQPFSALNFLSTGASGQRMLFVLQSAVSVSEGRVLVRVVSSTGAQVYSTDLGLLGSAVTARMWDSVVSRRVQMYTNDLWSTEAKAREGLKQALVRPRYSPVISNAVLGQDGTVWLRLTTETNGRATWRVLSPAGAMLGSVTLPAETRILDVTTTKAVGVVKDADGIEQPFWMTVGPR